MYQVIPDIILLCKKLREVLVMFKQVTEKFMLLGLFCLLMLHVDTKQGEVQQLKETTLPDLPLGRSLNTVYKVNVKSDNL